jgi:3-oxoacyl-[acyl-carrier-protein] synthase III
MDALYLSAPGIELPTTKWTNEDQLAKVREQFRGTDKEWAAIRRRLKLVFDVCKSNERYYESDPAGHVADYAVAAARACLDTLGIAAEHLDMVLNGSITREYFEPATAMEISAKLGLERVLAFDVTSACAGLLQAVHVAAAFMHHDPSIERALVCAAELIGGYLPYDIQTAEDIALRSARLTLGDGAAAFVVSRSPLPVGGRILGLLSQSLPQHHDLCRATIHNEFQSNSTELFKLGAHVPGHLIELLRRCGKTPADVDHWICHQPSDSVVKATCVALDLDLDRVPLCHGLFGNTITGTVPMTLDYTLRTKTVRPGDLLVLTTSAAGFTMVSLLLEWGAGHA